MLVRKWGGEVREKGGEGVGVDVLDDSSSSEARPPD